ncbi:asparagine synthase-related protein [Planktotalea sp.]|uniref:asparagine synthase-related protein n=1 Tax=Planktotalea sp. TaxID=2029877 RepID=UPI003D6AC941
MQTGLLGAVWQNDPQATLDAQRRAFQQAAFRGEEGASQSLHLSSAAFASVTLPSNAANAAPPEAQGLSRFGSVKVAADAWLVNSAALALAHDLAADCAPAELIAQLYEKSGEAGLDQLDGDYAFALFDASTNRLILRRDPFGVRPLFWARMPEGGVVFSSLPEVLVTSGCVPDQPDLDGLIDMISRSSADRPQTLVKGLNRVPACTQITFQSAQPDAIYTSLTTLKPRPSDTPKTFDGWSAELGRLMSRAVQTRLPAQGDIATSMSSGLDSTSVTMLAERHLGEQQHIFAKTYAASDAASDTYPGILDETEIAASVVARSNRISHEKIKKPEHAEWMTPRIDPISFVMDTPEFRLTVAAQQSGADVILTGWGGDDAVSYKGFGVAAALLRTGKFRALRDMSRAQRMSPRRAVRFYAKSVFDAFVPAKSQLRAILLRQRKGSPAETYRAMSGLKPAFRRDSPRLDFRVGDTQENRRRRLGNPILPFRMEILACHGFRNGIRYVHPLLDRTLNAFALTCPPEFEQRDGLFRAPVRAAMEGIVSDEARLKASVGYPLVEMVLNVARTKEMLQAEFEELAQDKRLHEWFDFPYIRTQLALLPTMEQAEAHVREIAAGGPPRGLPTNVSFSAVAAMKVVQANLDKTKAK